MGSIPLLILSKNEAAAAAWSHELTLIFSHVSEITGLFTLSDVVVSKPSAENDPLVEIPFRNKPFQHQNAGYALAALSQKAVIFGRTLVLWAGWQEVARYVISELRKVSRDGADQIDLLKHLKDTGLSTDELDGVSFIYHYRSSDTHIFISYWNSKIVKESGHDVLSAGSGVWNFFDNMPSLTGYDLPPHEIVLGSFLAKIAQHSFLEHSGTETLDHLYGGWFELTYATADSFSKVPHAFKFWTMHEGILGSGGPVFFGWYHGHRLVVSRFQPRETNGSVFHEQKHFTVPDFLRRADRIGPPNGPIRPYQINHIVLNFDKGCQNVFIDSDMGAENMIIEASERGVRIAIKNELRAHLIELANNYADRPAYLPD